MRSDRGTVLRRLLLVLGGILVLGTGLVLGAVGVSYVQPSGEPSDTAAVQRGCVIRFDTLGEDGKTEPRIHANSAHICVGVSWMQVSVNGYLRVYLDTNEPVIDVQVTEDETLTRLGISCGPSGGKGHVDLYCYDRAGNFIHADDIFGANTNLWLHVTSWRGELT